MLTLQNKKKKRETSLVSDAVNGKSPVVKLGFIPQLPEGSISKSI